MNCDRIARWYRWMESASFGRALHRRRCHFLSGLRAEKILLLGDGDGRFLAALARQCPMASIDYVDVSGQMLKLASQRTPPNEYVRFYQRDAVSDQLPSSGYDLIITHFFLDCFTPEELREVVAKISAAASTGARWIISEFHQPTGGWRRLRAVIWIRSLYAAFHVLTGLQARQLPEYASALREHGFRQQAQMLASAGLLVSELWERD